MQNRKAFLEAVQQPATSIDTAYCALLFSQALNPALNLQHHSGILGSLTDDAENAGIDCAEALLSFLHGKHRFRGNPDDYYQVENSLLDCVLDKRVGIPISLALVYLAIGNTTGLSVYGISFPGHFLVGVNSKSDTESLVFSELNSQHAFEPDDKLIDPFSASLVSRKQCFVLLDHLYQGQMEHSNNYFTPAGNDSILLRLIENVKAIYLKQGEVETALTCLDYQLLISPHNSRLLNQQQQMRQHINKQGGESSVVH